MTSNCASKQLYWWAACAKHPCHPKTWRQLSLTPTPRVRPGSTSDTLCTDQEPPAHRSGRWQVRGSSGNKQRPWPKFALFMKDFVLTRLLRRQNKRSGADLFSKCLIKWGFEKVIVRNPKDLMHRRGCPHSEYTAMSWLKKCKVINQEHWSRQFNHSLSCTHSLYGTAEVQPSCQLGKLAPSQRATKKDKQLSSVQLAS